MPSFKNIDLTKAAIIGIGSPHEGDELGWQAIEVLQKNKSIKELEEKGLSLFTLDRPGILLGETIKNYEHVLIIDAMKPGNTKEPFVWVDTSKINSIGNTFSSHNIGLAESLELIREINTLPKDIALLAIVKVSNKNLIDNVLQCLN